MAETTALGSFLKSGVANRRGYSQQAANHMREALAQVVWDDEDVVMEAGGWMLFCNDAVEEWCVYIDSDNRRVAINGETYETLGEHGPALNKVRQDFMRDGQASGMKFIVQDAGPYAEAARKRAEIQGRATTQQKDLLEDLEARAGALLLQAASLNQAPTLLQQQVFTGRLAQINMDIEALMARVARLRSQVDLAATAVVDAMNT